MPRVLVVDDDATVAEVVLTYLRREGLDAASTGDGISPLAIAESAPPDLVVLDLMLPGLDGLEVCRRLRAANPDLPVVMLTARGSEEDRIAGLEVGADDYVVKPFSPRELALRVASVLRRTEPRAAASGGETFVDADLVVDTRARTVVRDGVALALTTRELDLLAFLMANPGRAVQREELMREVWGWDFGDLTTVTVHVRRLREKVEDAPSSPVRLVTVWGVGYRWDPRPGSPLDVVAQTYRRAEG